MFFIMVFFWSFFLQFIFINCVYVSTKFIKANSLCVLALLGNTPAVSDSDISRSDG